MEVDFPMNTIKSQRYLPAPLTHPRIQRGRLPNGTAGTRRTLELMVNLIREGARDFYVRQTAIDILLNSAVPAKAYLEEIETLFRWVQRNIRYTKDPYRSELLTSALRILQLRIGDCDDMTVLLGSMLEAIGHPVRIVVAGYRRDKPSLFSHVYLEVYYQGQCITLDPTMPYPMGWEAPWAIRAKMPIHNYNIVAPTFKGCCSYFKEK